LHEAEKILGNKLLTPLKSPAQCFFQSLSNILLLRDCNSQWATMPVLEKSSSMGGDACSREALLSPGSQQDDTVIPRDTVSAGEAACSRETLLTPLTPGAEGDDVVTVRDTASTNDDAYSRETLLNPLTPGSQQDDDVIVRYTSSYDKPSLTKRPVFHCWSRPRVRKRSTSDGY